MVLMRPVVSDQNPLSWLMLNKLSEASGGIRMRACLVRFATWEQTVLYNPVIILDGWWWVLVLPLSEWDDKLLVSSSWKFGLSSDGNCTIVSPARKPCWKFATLCITLCALSFCLLMASLEWFVVLDDSTLSNEHEAVGLSRVKPGCESLEMKEGALLRSWIQAVHRMRLKQRWWVHLQIPVCLPVRTQSKL